MLAGFLFEKVEISHLPVGGPLAPGPAEALEDMRRHLTRGCPVLTAGPETRTSPCTLGLSSARSSSNPPLVWLL